ncbi:MAG: peptide chain release factor-like protein, partial [Bacteroidota bacterium]
MDLSPEIKYHFSRSQGAGGQNVNKVNTKVNLAFNVLKSEILTEKEKEKILKKIGKRLTKAGVLRLSSQKGRTQMKNRLLVTQNF